MNCLPNKLLKKQTKHWFFEKTCSSIREAPANPFSSKIASKYSSFPCTLSFKVQLFWEGHKDLRHPPYGFDVYYVSKYQNHKEDGANFCGLLRKAELYQLFVIMPIIFELFVWTLKIIFSCFLLKWPLPFQSESLLTMQWGIL